MSRLGGRRKLNPVNSLARRASEGFAAKCSLACASPLVSDDKVALSEQGSVPNL